MAPMGEVQGKTNCQKCIDCEPMTGECYKCYGEMGGTPLKRVFSEGEKQPPRVAPAWCPNRQK